MDVKIAKVLEKIENMEKTWVLTASKDKEVQKRFPNSNKQIKLWSVPRTTGEFLRFLILATNSKNILELGTSAGYSTLWILDAVKKTKGHINTIENFKPKIELAKENFKEGEVERFVSLVEKDIKDVLNKWNFGELDFVFMDADKQKYHIYYEKILPHLKAGGIIVADNVKSHEEFMLPFLEKVKTDKRIVSYLLEIGNGLMLIYKK